MRAIIPSKLSVIKYLLQGFLASQWTYAKTDEIFGERYGLNPNIHLDGKGMLHIFSCNFSDHKFNVA
jgi:hypothetical protein